MEQEKEYKKGNPILGITLWSIASILALIAVPIFMYVAYAVAVKSDPNVSLTVGYWVGFIFILIPLATLFYGYSRKLHDSNDKRYLACYICGLLALIVIIVLILLGALLQIPA